MKNLLLVLGYGLIVFAFLDFILSWIYPDPLKSWYIFIQKHLGGLSVVTPIILYFFGSWVVKFASDKKDNQN